MTTLRRAVYADCERLLDHKYKWVANYGWYGTFPKFKMPEEPSVDIAKALAWIPKVEAESKGVDSGDDGWAVNFRDGGTKVYNFNRNNVWKHAEGATKEEKELAVARWTALQEACYECRRMMRALHYNPW